MSSRVVAVAGVTVPKYLRIKNYDQYQQHQFKNPDYVKLFWSFYHDDKVFTLTNGIKMLYVGMISLSARVPERLMLANIKWVCGQLGLDDEDFQPLVDVGLVEVVECDAPATPIAKSGAERQAKYTEKKKAAPLTPKPTLTVVPDVVAPTTMPDNWGPHLDGKLVDYAVAQGIMDPKATWASFKAYAASHPDWKHHNWNTTWQRWCRKEGDKLPPAPPIKPAFDTFELALAPGRERANEVLDLAKKLAEAKRA